MGKPTVKVYKHHNRDGTVTTKTTVSKNGVTESWTTRERPDNRKEHSFIGHLFLCFFGIGFLTIPYITLSSKHKWRFF